VRDVCFRQSLLPARDQQGFAISSGQVAGVRASVSRGAGRRAACSRWPRPLSTSECHGGIEDAAHQRRPSSIISRWTGHPADILLAPIAFPASIAPATSGRIAPGGGNSIAPAPHVGDRDRLALRHLIEQAGQVRLAS